MKNNLRTNLYRVWGNVRALMDSIFRSTTNLLSPGQKRLLIVKIDSIGDYLLFRSFLAEIRSSEKFRGYEITLCGNNKWKGLCEELDGNFVDRFIWVDYSAMTDEIYQENLCIQLRKQRFTIAITPTYSRSWHTDRLMHSSGAKETIAPAGDAVNISEETKVKNDRRYSRLIGRKEQLDFEFERNRSFFSELLGKPLVNVKAAFRNPQRRFLKVVVCPGAGAAERQWHPHYFYQICVYLQSEMQGGEFVICGQATEKHLANAVVNSGTEVIFTNLSGTQSLPEFYTSVSQATLVLCNDSAPYHMAALLDIPVICISNGNHYGRFCPYPLHYNKKNLEIFPSSLLLPPVHEKIKELQYKGSGYDINEITPGQVITRLNESDFLHEIIHHHYKS